MTGGIDRADGAPLLPSQTPKAMAEGLRDMALKVETGEWPVDTIIVMGDGDLTYGYRVYGRHSHPMHILGIMENNAALLRQLNRGKG